MDEKPAPPVPAHHHADTVQPALPNRLPPTDHTHDTVLSVNAFHEFLHDAHDRRTH
jgi:hypothetical protein